MVKAVINTTGGVTAKITPKTGGLPQQVSVTLPSGSSFYAVKDLDTNEYVIEFSEYTKISADTTSSYFDIYMNGLEPERYYKVLVQVTAGGSTTVYDDKYYFKVING